MIAVDSMCVSDDEYSSSDVIQFGDLSGLGVVLSLNFCFVYGVFQGFYELRLLLWWRLLDWYRAVTSSNKTYLFCLFSLKELGG